VFITAHDGWSAQTVADIYKSRWEVELFLTCIKQNLKIRSVLGHTINAVARQIFVALCSFLLIAYQKFVSETGYGLQAVFRLVQINAKSFLCRTGGQRLRSMCIRMNPFRLMRRMVKP
jgi:putative transposase